MQWQSTLSLPRDRHVPAYLSTSYSTVGRVKGAFTSAESAVDVLNWLNGWQAGVNLNKIIALVSMKPDRKESVWKSRTPGL